MADISKLLNEVLSWMKFVEECRERDNKQERKIYYNNYSNDTSI